MCPTLVRTLTLRSTMSIDAGMLALMIVMHLILLMLQVVVAVPCGVVGKAFLPKAHASKDAQTRHPLSSAYL